MFTVPEGSVKCHCVVSPFGFTVPCNTAEVEVTSEAAPVTTAGKPPPAGAAVVNRTGEPTAPETLFVAVIMKS